MALFNNSKSDAPIDVSAEPITSFIAPGATIDGPFTAKESTRVDGIINGNVTISGSLIVGQGGKIAGTVSATNLFLAGEIKGAVSVPNGKVEISDTGKLEGDLAAKILVIDENAIFQGQCQMTSDKSSAEKAKERAKDKSKDE